MKSRETLIRLKRFQVDEKRRRVAQIEMMIADFERMAADLDREIATEEQRAGISDPAHFAYPTYAKRRHGQRRDNLRRSADDLQGPARRRQGRARRGVRGAEEGRDPRGPRARAPSAPSTPPATRLRWTRSAFRGTLGRRRSGRSTGPFGAHGGARSGGYPNPFHGWRSMKWLAIPAATLLRFGRLWPFSEVLNN